MNRTIKRLICCVLAAISMFSFGACDKDNGNTTKPEHLGLYLEDGEMYHDGKPFHGLGVNYYSMFNYCFSNKWSTEVPCAALEKLAEYDVKVIRFSCEPPSSLGAAKWDWYFQRKERYYETLDTIVKKAEEVGIGLLVEFFGDLHNISNYFEEPMGESVRDENSQSSQFRHDYVKEVVTRYKDSPAIYGWEFGNELAWETLLPDGYRKTEDMRLNEVNLLYSRFAETVKEYDSYNRIVGNGDQSLRNHAYNSTYHNTFDVDTLAQHREILSKLNPDGMDAMCMHRYADGAKIKDFPEKLNTIDGKPYNLLGEDGKQFKLYETWTEYLTYMKDESKRMGKTCYLGESGWLYADSQEKQTYEDALSAIEGIAKAAYDTDYPLILFWNYDPLTNNLEGDFVDRGSGIEYSWNEKWGKGKAYLEIIKKYNALFTDMNK
ncbi:cellulase family glycosylhydrolase [Pumilibacter intestinalis]|uniref:cellulase family glycosylhydrolase n=1 Tax=Pumilibacter intestinalis TaxID=2941511 RepID=UPI00203B503E|nr:cellulase family glycosylhydrolase [Pumilibacter intestinalis]